MHQIARDMHVVAIIPARGGSKRIPRKNLLALAGRPMLAYSLLHARQASRVKDVYVSTEDADIADLARAHEAEVVWRPADLANDTATSESALLHVLDDRRRRGLQDPDLFVFLQPTSPVRRPGDIDRAIEALLAAEADSLFSACDFNRLIWAEKGNELYSLNYDYRRRQREQEMARQWRENGSIYVVRPEVLRRYNNRLGGRMAIYEMDYWSSFQLDAPEHAELLSWILQRPEYAPQPVWPERIDLVVFDFDGVMTDNTVLVTQSGEEAVACNRSDGWGMARLRDAGVPMLVLSTEANAVVSARCAKLGLPCLHGQSDKAASLADYLRREKIDPAHVVYLGNDVNDLGCLRMVGLPMVVADAHPAAAAAARFVLGGRGGRGAVRELCDLILAHAGAETDASGGGVRGRAPETLVPGVGGETS